MKRFLTFAICATLALPAAAAPALTQHGDKTTAHITGDRSDAIHIDELNAFRAKHPTEFKGKLCNLQSFNGRSDITAATAEEREFLDWSFQSSRPVFHVWANGTKLSIGSAIYEKCDGQLGSILTITTIEETPEHLQTVVLLAKEFDDMLPLYLFEPKEKGYIAGFSSCLNCGDFTEIRYNAKTKKFNLVYTGD